MAIYRDVSDSSMFASEITWCYNTGLLRGWPDGTFRPLSPVARDAMAVVMHRIAGQPEIRGGGPNFSDVAPGQQFAAEIGWVQSRGLLNGWSDGTFRPLAPIARDATCALFYRAAGSPGYTPPAASPFRDVRPNQQFYKEMCWAQSRGITTGYRDGTMRPTTSINRDAVAAFLYRFDQATG